LRSLYFVLSEAVTRLYYLRLGLAAILVFVGLKMALAHWAEVPIAASLLTIVACLGVAGLASAIRTRRLAAPASTRRLCEERRTEFTRDEAFGCRRHLRMDEPVGPDDHGQRPADAPPALGEEGDAREGA